MAKIMGFGIPQQFMTGMIAGAFSSILVWLASFVEPIAQALIAAIQGGRAGVVTGTAVGTQLIKTLGGAFSVPDLIWAALGGGVLVVIGTWIYDQKWSPNSVPGFKATPISRMTLVLFYASLAATLVLTAFAIPPLQALVVLAINSIVTAWFVVKVLGEQLNLV